MQLLRDSAADVVGLDWAVRLRIEYVGWWVRGRRNLGPDARDWTQRFVHNSDGGLVGPLTVPCCV